MSKLYLIPTPLGDVPPAQCLSAPVLEKIKELRCFVVEELRSARRFLSAAGHRGHVEELELHLLNEHSSPSEVQALAGLFERGDVGLVSEAGLPAVADPGAALVELCHAKGIEVVPMIGPSSLMLALMASGMNGQSFAFAGYVSAKSEERKNELRRLEKISSSQNQSQIIIETPYRNDSLLNEMLGCLGDSTRLCVAADLTLESQTVKSMSIAQWKRLVASGFTIGKRPCVFVLYSNSTGTKNSGR